MFLFLISFMLPLSTHVLDILGRDISAKIALQQPRPSNNVRDDKLGFCLISESYAVHPCLWELISAANYYLWALS